MGRFDEAIGCIQRSLQLRPGDAAALDSLGVALAGKGQYYAALSKYAEALRSDPDEPIIYCHMAQSLRKLRRNKEAEEKSLKAKLLNQGLECGEE
jgi:tetratricopeptide (TPR) repeat protein